MRKHIALIFVVLFLPLLAAQQLYIPPFTLPATTCTNQFIRSIAAATGVGACATVVNADLATMSTSTIKGQTVGGSGAPVDLTATQAAAIVGTVGGALKSKIITITRDLTVATGAVSYTGMGFQPTACFALGEVAGSLTQYVTIFGMSDSTGTGKSLGLGASLINRSGTLLIAQDITGANLQTATIASYDADGLSLTWTKTGSPTGTFTADIMCFR